jgi:hypothetical protein
VAKRQYNNDYPSVTQIIDVLRKIGLEAWFKYNTPQFIREQSEKGKLIGTQIHDGIQAYIKGEKVEVKTEYSTEVSNALKSFALFRKDHPEIKLHSSEVELTSEQHGFNGTLDCLAEDTELLITDWKTGNAKDKDKPDIYDEYRYQVAAYVNLYNEVNNAKIKKALIIAFAKDKVAYNHAYIDENEILGCFAEVFLPALRIWKYQHRLKLKEG